MTSQMSWAMLDVAAEKCGDVVEMWLRHVGPGQHDEVADHVHGDKGRSR